MSREEIDGIVCEIMADYGPDGHTDGSEIITDFIVALLAGKGETWTSEHLRGH